MFRHKNPLVNKEVELPATAPLPTKSAAAAKKTVVEIIVPDEKIQTEANESVVAIEEKSQSKI